MPLFEAMTVPMKFPRFCGNESIILLLLVSLLFFFFKFNLRSEDKEDALSAFFETLRLDLCQTQFETSSLPISFSHLRQTKSAVFAFRFEKSRLLFMTRDLWIPEMVEIARKMRNLARRALRSTTEHV